MKCRILFILILLYHVCPGQDYSKFTNTVASLYACSGVLDPAERNSKTETLWRSLVDSHAIPLTQEDSVAFLYKGEANTVSWMGDFNGWGYNRKFNNKGVRIPNTDIWILKTSFPKDARLDYKIYINNSDWIIDPVNPHQQWSGVGGGSPNSELRMPRWKQDPIAIPKNGIATGKLEKDKLFNSKSLGYQLTYSVYLPAGYSSSIKYPAIYVTDGYEYMHDQMGNMLTILDNLIDQKKIKPVVAIFIDHREPVNRSNNRRMNELAMNKNYLSFFKSEFIPHLEGKYSISSHADERGILGNSFGGLTSAYFAFTEPGIFGLTGIQSPAFKYKPEIYTVCDNPDNPPVKVFLTSGVFNDAEVEARRMKDILDKNLCNYKYTETNQGNSWGNFKDSIDDILIYFFAAQ